MEFVLFLSTRSGRTMSSETCGDRDSNTRCLFHFDDKSSAAVTIHSVVTSWEDSSHARLHFTETRTRHQDVVWDKLQRCITFTFDKDSLCRVLMRFLVSCSSDSLRSDFDLALP